ncbi:MAG: SprT family zinc-dependent metalloprotease [Bacilli bacterium]
MKYKFENGLSIEVELIRKNTKNIYFRVKEDLKLYVSVPIYVSQREIYRLMEKNSKDIIKMYEKMEDKVKDNDKYFYLGKKYFIVIDDVENVTFNEKEVHVKSIDELNKFTNKEMLRIFNEEVELSKKCFARLPEFLLKTRKMSTRWGVCDVKKKIVTLNTELIKKDINIIDYVIIHELCHFYEANHSKAFWDLVSEAFPKYKEARKKLKE